MPTVSIIGATTWGNTIGRLLANKGITVNIWARTEARARELSKGLQQYPPNSGIIKNITFTAHSDKALQAAEFVIWAVPAQSLRQAIRQVAKQVTSDMIHVSLAKGLEADSGHRMTEVITEEIPITSPDWVCVLSGPNLSQEINRGLPATSVLAARNAEVAKKAFQLFHSPNFAIFSSDDVVGVELCGALKNIIALGAGMVDGLGLGDNAKATLITFGWAEVTSLGTALGARSSTFYSLAGLGDLIATCAGPQSRNHFVGREVASGHPLGEVKAAMSNIAEGIDTTVAAYRLAAKLGLEIPIISLIYKVLFEFLPPVEITNRFKLGLKPEASV
jgi:glycerol-3-phosphate dehydrogenase (NAD(P)+)